MGKRRQSLPLWVQVFLVWLVMSGLLTMGLCYLRADGKVSDRVFRPLGLILCHGDEEIETGWGWASNPPRTNLTSDEKRRRGVQILGPAATFRSAECVSQSGARRPATGFLPSVWLPFAVVMAVLLLPAFRRRPRKQSSQ